MFVNYIKNIYLIVLKTAITITKMKLAYMKRSKSK